MKLREVVWGVGTHLFGNNECGGLPWGEAEEKETRCAPKEGREMLLGVHRYSSVVRIAREWLTCRESRSGPFQEQLSSSDCSM